MSLYFRIKSAFKDSADLANFHPQFRLEARARDAENDDSLAMRTADPLWMLGRQWQMGEFEGEDNGSPILAVSKYLKEKVNYFTTETSASVSVKDLPLEVKVESIPVKPEYIDLRAQAKIGEQLKRIIRRRHPDEASKFITTLQTKYPLKPVRKADETSKRFMKLMQKKAINGAEVLKELEEGTFVNRDTEFNQLAGVTDELKQWFAVHYHQGTENPDADAWNSQHLSHKFKVSAKNETEGKSLVDLEAPDYQSGHLDWYSFDRAVIKYKDEDFVKAHPLSSSVFFPNNLSFGAQPHKRLFAFEDRMVDLGNMNIQEDDLIRIMLLDFSLYSGSDWYTLPLEMEMGEVCWIKKIIVKDIFGVETVVVNGKHTNSKGETIHSGPSFRDMDGDNTLTGLDVWDVFKIRDKTPDEYKLKEHLLYLAPVANGRQESEPLEEVLFFKDEYSNMVWGQEKRVLNAMGKPTDGYDQHLELNERFIPISESDSENNDGHSLFRLASTVPFNWIPYLLYTDGYLKQALMIGNEADNSVYREIPVLTELMKNDLSKIREEAIPKAGVRVQVTKQRVRWTDGKTYIWKGRKVLTGRGEGDSGLRFDYLK